MVTKIAILGHHFGAQNGGNALFGIILSPNGGKKAFLGHQFGRKIVPKNALLGQNSAEKRVFWHHFGPQMVLIRFFGKKKQRTFGKLYLGRGRSSNYVPGPGVFDLSIKGNPQNDKPTIHNPQSDFPAKW